MTNHPGRKRGDDEEPAAAEEMAAMPAVQEFAAEMAAQLPPQAPPGLSPNGHGPTARLMEALPQMLFQAVTQALSSVQVRTAPLKCLTCVTARLAWGARYEAEINAAQAAYVTAMSELTPDDPRRGLLQPLAFLPEALRPSGDPAHPNLQAMPEMADGIAMAGGSLYCPEHVPGAAQQAGRKPFLIAQGSLNAAMIAEIRGNAA
jgi:hypothetical protein